MLGLKRNWEQFVWLIIVNAFVGSMVGMERTLLPLLAESRFGLVAKTFLLSFIAAFGLSKAVANYFAGRLADRFTRKRLLVIGWLIGLPVPFLLIWAPSWSWVVFANILLGVSQGLTWSMTIIMKIDLVGPVRRGLAMGLNEFAGYLAVALSAWVTGALAANYGLGPEPFYLGVISAVAGLTLSLFVVRDTGEHVRFEREQFEAAQPGVTPSSLFLHVSFRDRNLSAVTQAGLINNLNDGVAWGVFPIFFALQGMSLYQVGVLVAAYPAAWGLCQLATGALSDRFGRKPLIASGMWLQGIAIAMVIGCETFAGFMAASLALGVGTAMVYPTLVAAIGDAAAPKWRASAIGIYRLWRDSGYAIGAVVAGVLADHFGMSSAIGVVAAITFLSGVVVAVRMRS